MDAPRPFNLIAELTYRCPLRCPYCSNPLGFRDSRDALGTDDWTRIFAEAAALGVVHVGLTGGEPSLRSDLEEIVAGADKEGLYTHLVTAGMPIDAARLSLLQQAGLRSVQLSIQDATGAESDEIAGVRAFERKLEFARAVRSLELPLVLNVVLHRRNLMRVPEIIALARDLDAERLELAHTQYHGWALPNRAALMPTREQVDGASAAVEAARHESGRPEILLVLPDHFSERPKPCMGGWGARNIVVTPDGSVQPCHSASSLPGLEFWNARERPLAECWAMAPGMNAFRGESWMDEPCRSCPEKTHDFGGCRCQAFALTGSASATDPACALSPHRGALLATRESSVEAMIYRGDRVP
jgi:pyrroloquinoline quinone biosynthesis protein E